MHNILVRHSGLAILEELEAELEAHQAERQVALLDCVAAAEEAGIITADQAAALTQVIEDGTLRDLWQSDAFDGFFPNLGGRDGLRGRGGRGRFGGFGGFGGNGMPDDSPEATEAGD